MTDTPTTEAGAEPLWPVTDDAPLSPAEEQRIRDAVSEDGHETPFSYQTVCRLLATLDALRLAIEAEARAGLDAEWLWQAVERVSDDLEPGVVGLEWERAVAAEYAALARQKAPRG